jgi:phenylalanyl-tRNA synthetase beta chain
MKISYLWLSEYIDVSSWSVERIAEMLTEIGLEVEGVEKKENIKGGLRGVVVGEVGSCKSHPNADRLQLTQVDIGAEQPLSIVCGAPNVAKGQKVAVATVGTHLYFSDGKELEIKSGKIRGEVSEGMICAEDELGISEDHDGIMVLSPETEVGRPLSDYVKVWEDYIIDIDLTPNRADAVCHLGVAEDLAAYINTNEETAVSLRTPAAPTIPGAKDKQPMEIAVERTDLCPRYAGVVIADIKVGPSAPDIAEKLTSIGLRPVNNIVDITQYVLHEMGQPLHAFDYAVIEGQKIIVDTLPSGTVFTSLEGEEIKLTGEEVMICDGQRKPMCMGGIFGGVDSGVSQGTQSVFIESAYFDAQAIRKASMHHDLRTDAAKVYEKGADPNRVIAALNRAADLILRKVGGRVVSRVFDTQPEGLPHPEVFLSYKKLHRYLGVTLSKVQVKEICQQLQMAVLEDRDEGILLQIPTNKPDVLREVDVIEEVVRIYGLDNIPVPDQARMPLQATSFPTAYDYRDKVSYSLNGAGLSEAMSLSLVNADMYEGEEWAEGVVEVNNTSNQHLDAMRREMYSSMLQNLSRNSNRQERDLGLFEFGRIYYQDPADQWKEEERLSIGIMGRRMVDSRFASSEEQVSFFDVKAHAMRVFDCLGLAGFQVSEIEDHPILSYGLRWHRGPQVLAELGKVRNKFGGYRIDAEVFCADIHWGRCLDAVRSKEFIFESLNKYPAVERDLALVLERGVSFEEVERAIYKAEKKLVREVHLFDHYENEEQLGKGKKSYAIRVKLQSDNQTLKDKNVEKIMSKIMKSLEKSSGAQLR